MSVQDQIDRLTVAKEDIANAITSKGVTVPSTASLSDMASYINQISTSNLLYDIDFENITEEDKSYITSNTGSLIRDINMDYIYVPVYGVTIPYIYVNVSADEGLIRYVIINWDTLLIVDEGGVSIDGQTTIDSELSLTSTNPVQNKVLTEQIGAKSIAYYMNCDEISEANVSFLNAHPGSFIHNSEDDLVYHPVACDNPPYACCEYVAISLGGKKICRYAFDWTNMSSTYSEQPILGTEYGTIEIGSSTSGGTYVDFDTGTSKFIKLELSNIVESSAVGNLEIYTGTASGTPSIFATIPVETYYNGLSIEVINYSLRIRDSEGKIVAKGSYGVLMSKIRFVLYGDDSSSYIEFSYRLEA